MATKATVGPKSSISATITTVSTPVVSKIIQGQSGVNDITGIQVDYGTVSNNYVLAYQASTNTFVAQAVTTEVDGGLFNNGTF